VKCAEIKGITGGENLKTLHIDSEVLKCGYQMGFVTPVVHTLTYGNRSMELLRIFKKVIAVFLFSIFTFLKKWNFLYKFFQIIL